MSIDQLQDHSGGGQGKILMTMQDKTRKVLAKCFSKIGGGGEAMNSDMKEYFMDVHGSSLFCRLMFWGQ